MIANGIAQWLLHRVADALHRREAAHQRIPSGLRNACRSVERRLLFGGYPAAAVEMRCEMYGDIDPSWEHGIAAQVDHLTHSGCGKGAYPAIGDADARIAQS